VAKASSEEPSMDYQAATQTGKPNQQHPLKTFLPSKFMKEDRERLAELLFGNKERL
jgi:hypothetical protein